MGFLVIWCVFGILAATIARSKGRSFWRWFFYGLFLGLIALIHALVMKDDSSATTRQSFSGSSEKKCPECSEFVKSDAKVCRYCGHSFVTLRSVSNYNESTQITQNQWRCYKCGCTSNFENSNWCKDCNAPRYSMESISETQKSIIKEYIDKQLQFNNFEQVFNLQKSYFATTSLSYMKFILPDVNGFKELDDYKNKLKEIIGEKKVESVAEEVNDIKNNESVANDDIEIQLEKLKNLFEKNLINENEYNQKKAKLLGL